MSGGGDFAIRVEGLGKRYRLGRGGTLFARRTETLWALRQVRFEVGQGEVVGIIGPNGSGKSTLLRLLAQITEPTEGRATIRGRVGSLLEVGTGFHPDLTGRENIYVNGAMLGMKRREIDRRFAEIVAFAELERFLDTPVKRYSSGMYVRLAFAVAAHLEADILLVDEVLAVGDLAFQERCLQKLGSLTRDGRTVLFVSHNLVAVEGLCSRAIRLDHGQVAALGPAVDVIRDYIAGNRRAPAALNIEARAGNGAVRIVGAQARGTSSGPGLMLMGEGLEVVLDLEAQAAARVSLSFVVATHMGFKLFNASTRDVQQTVELEGGRRTRWVCRVGPLPLRAGAYHLDLGVAGATANDTYDYLPRALNLEVTPRDVLGSGQPLAASDGVVYFPYVWETGST
ncbi:MAG: ABC transporter ATP-binding protein [Deltaproteobacteria bacterium]|nr:ABC transporter ATP-binding protein [Deltaproteobacteria bacterium]